MVESDHVTRTSTDLGAPPASAAAAVAFGEGSSTADASGRSSRLHGVPAEDAVGAARTGGKENRASASTSRRLSPRSWAWRSACLSLVKPTTSAQGDRRRITCPGVHRPMQCNGQARGGVDVLDQDRARPGAVRRPRVDALTRVDVSTAPRAGRRPFRLVSTRMGRAQARRQADLHHGARCRRRDCSGGAGREVGAQRRRDEAEAGVSNQPTGPRGCARRQCLDPYPRC
jgi:hypothetical protein